VPERVAAGFGIRLLVLKKIEAAFFGPAIAQPLLSFDQQAGRRHLSSSNLAVTHTPPPLKLD
jgi:hypothetical protein